MQEKNLSQMTKKWLITRLPVIVLLVDDQSIIAESIRRMLGDHEDIVFHYCSNPAQAVQMAVEVKPTVILQDLVMPDMDGLTLVKCFRANPATKDIPLIVLSAKEDPKVKAEAFACGANDYAVKLPDKIELLARIRYHSTAYIRLLERNEAYEKLEESQSTLNAELAEAAEYVRSMLPDPLTGSVDVSWRFIPSAHLGGDVFGYHWIDEDHFAIYLLDVCGHGIGAALLSISVIDVLRLQTLPNANFLKPETVLEALNQLFPMDKHHNMFFTIWYGVYNKKERTLTYSCGGHPPAILLTGPNVEHARFLKLTTPGLVIGAMPDSKFQSATCAIKPFNRLFLFSDGVFELQQADGSNYTYQKFVDYLYKLISQTGHAEDELDRILHHCRKVHGKEFFEDDYSLVKIVFN